MTRMTRRVLKRLGAIHERAMQLRLQGLTYRDIGARLHRSPKTVEAWFGRDPTFQAAYAALRQEQTAQAREALVRMAMAAAERLGALLDHPNPFIALAAAKDVLDRLGIKAPERRELAGGGGGPIRLMWEDGSPVDVG